MRVPVSFEVFFALDRTTGDMMLLNGDDFHIGDEHLTESGEQWPTLPLAAESGEDGLYDSEEEIKSKSEEDASLLNAEKTRIMYKSQHKVKL